MVPMIGGLGVPELLILVSIPVFVIPFVWWVKCLIQALTTSDQHWAAAGESKILYVLLMIFLGLIGTILYALVARPALRRVGNV